MAYSVVPSAVTGDIIPASYGNILRDNDAYLKSVVDGTLANQIPGTALAAPLTRGSNNVNGIVLGASAAKAHLHEAQAGAVQLGSNLSYDGSNYQRDDVSQAAYLLQAFTNNIAGLYAPAGANPATVQTLFLFDSTGKLTGKGFFSSGEVSVANSTTATIAHGLGARPRFVCGYHLNVTGTEDSKVVPIAWIGTASQVTFSNVDATNISAFNQFGATRFIWVYAMR